MAITRKDYGKISINKIEVEDGTIVTLGAESFSVACTSAGNAIALSTVTIPFGSYIGTVRVGCKCTVGTLPSGVSVSTNTDATVSVDGSLVLSIAAGANFGNSSTITGNFTLTFKCNDIDFVKKISWSKIKAPINGTSAVLFMINSDTGNTIINGGGSIILNTLMYLGTTVVTPTKYQWKKLVGSQYTNISGATASTYEVTPSMVTSMTTFACTATYSSVDYTAYFSVYDRTDNIQPYMYNSLGSEIEDGKAEGICYVRLFQNGNEVDTLKSSTFSETAPTNPVNGDKYYHIDKVNDTVTLKMYSGSTWTNQTGVNESVYIYDIYRIIDSQQVDPEGIPWRSSKVFWVDNSVYGNTDTTTTFNIKISTRD